MTTLTDEQLAKVEQHYRRTLQGYADEPFTREIRALCDEVREYRQLCEQLMNHHFVAKGFSPSDTLHGLFEELDNQFQIVTKLRIRIMAAETEARKVVEVPRALGLDAASCPTCGNTPLLNFDAYCSHCGVRLKWEG